MRLVDADKLYPDVMKIDGSMAISQGQLAHAKTVEAIPKAEVKKFLEEGTKDVSNNVLAIVREDYIHKADYEARLKADMVAMLDKIRAEIIQVAAEETKEDPKWALGLKYSIKIIDKHAAESEET